MLSPEWPGISLSFLSQGQTSHSFMTEVNQAFINTSYSAFFQLAKANKQEEEDEAESKRQLGKDISTYFDMQKRKEKKGNN